MGTVTRKTGFTDNPFFDRTIYPIENTASANGVEYNISSGSGSATTGALPSDLYQYTALALNNEGNTTRYLYGVRRDGSEQSLGIYNVPFKTSGFVVTSETRVDNPSTFLLQSRDQSQYLAFSNSTLGTNGTTLNFTSPQGDYAVAVCFTTGTRIATSHGDVAVEDLRVGDRAVTASGALRPIVWIGHRDLGDGAAALPFAQQPIRVRAGAFGPGLPTRDLRLSPGHPVLIGAEADGAGGVLVPIMCLINGTTIVREPTTHVTYWHVELDAHDILLAEGLPAESYLDWGDRPFFTGGSDHALHDPDFVVPGLAARCRPVAVDGPLVEAERLRLDAVFAAELAGHAAWDDAADLRSLAG